MSETINPHPGEILKGEFLVPLDMSVAELTKHLFPGISDNDPIIQELVDGVRPLSAALAIRLSCFFGNSAEFWMNLQTRYELVDAEEAFRASKVSITPYCTLR